MNLEIQKQISLKEQTWWRVGGRAEYFCLPKNLEELKYAVVFAKEKSLNISILSGGTNTLVSDKGVRGLVIGLKKLNLVLQEIKENNLMISALAGAPKYELFKIFSKHKLAPALFLCGLPGDTGGGVVMNAGAGDDLFPKEFSQIVDEVEVFSFDNHELKVFRKSDLKWHYRLCSGWGEGLVYKVKFKWPVKEAPDFHQKLRAVNRKRTATQPLNQPSCGSVFKNPDGNKAGRLIEQAGLKGFRIGGAEVSQKHANFIVNNGSAKACDIDQIISHIKNKVKQEFNITLETEVRYMGEWG